MAKKRKEQYIPADEIKTGETYYVKIVFKRILNK